MRKLIIFICVICSPLTALCQTFMLGTKSVLGNHTILADDYLYARDTLGTANVKIIYDCRICIDTLNHRYFNMDYVLLGGNSISKFQPKAKYLYEKGMENRSPSWGMEHLQDAHFAYLYDAVYNDYANATQTCTGRLMQDDFEYSEPLTSQEWVLTDSVKTISSFTCTKALCEFRGRRYEVWFTEDLPVSVGPWKFRDLPGAIVSVSDSRHEYTFTLKSIEATNEYITKPRYKYTRLSRKKFNNLQSQYIHQPISYQIAHFHSEGMAIDPEAAKDKTQNNYYYDLLEKGN